MRWSFTTTQATVYNFPKGILMDELQIEYCFETKREKKRQLRQKQLGIFRFLKDITQKDLRQ